MSIMLRRTSGLSLSLICSATIVNSQELLIRPLTGSLDEFRVNEYASGVERSAPDVAIIDDESGDFVVVWGRWQSQSESQVLARRFNSFGIPLDENAIQVSDPSLDLSQYEPDPSVDGLGNGGFLVVWADSRLPGAPSDVFGQYVQGGGGVPFPNELLSFVGGNVEGPEVAIYNAGNGIGNGVLSWVAVKLEGADNDDVYMRPFSFFINPEDGWLRDLGDSTHLDSEQINIFDGEQDIVVDRDGRFSVVWRREYGATDSIKISRYSEGGFEIRERAILGDQSIRYPSIGVYQPSDPGDAMYVITWQGSSVIYAQVFDSNGGILGDVDSVYSGQIPATTTPRVATFQENDDFIVAWHAGASWDVADIMAKAYDRLGQTSLYQGTFQIGSSTGGNIHPRIATFKDRVYVTWLKNEDGEKNVYLSVLTVDNQQPIATGTWDEVGGSAIPDNRPYLRMSDLGSNNIVITTQASEIPSGRIASGLDEVRLIQAYEYSLYSSSCDSEVTRLMSDQGGYFESEIPRANLEAGTHVSYYVEAADSALNTERDPDLAPEQSFHVYVSEPGDIDFNGLLDYHDVSLLCLFLNEEMQFSGQDSFYADINVDGLINCTDYFQLFMRADPLPPIVLCPGEVQQALLPGPDRLEMGVGSGSPSELMTIPVYLDNDSSEVRDVYYSIEFDTTIVQLVQQTTTSRTSGFTVEQPCCTPSGPQVLMTGGSSTILTGSGSILTLTFAIQSGAPAGEYHITPSVGALGDGANKAIPHPAYRGKFFIPSPPPVSIVTTPIADTLLSPGDTLMFHTTLTNHSDSTKSPKFFVYGTTTGPDSFAFLAVDTSQIYALPAGGRRRSVTELEVPQGAPAGHYIFTAFVSDSSVVFDEDPFGFQISSAYGRPGAGGSVLTRSHRAMRPWRVISGWFGSKEIESVQASPEAEPRGLPKTVRISQNYPNPFNPSTTIQYAIPDDEPNRMVNISIFDLRGRRIRTLLDDVRFPGYYQVSWDGRDEEGQPVSSGVYLYRVIAGDFVSTRKMMVAK